MGCQWGEDAMPQCPALSSVAPGASHWSLRKNIVLDLSFPFDRWENCGPEEEHFSWRAHDQLPPEGDWHLGLWTWLSGGFFCFCFFSLCYINLNPNSCFIGFVSPSLIRWEIQGLSGGWVEECFSIKKFRLKRVSHGLILSQTYTSC